APDATTIGEQADEDEDGEQRTDDDVTGRTADRQRSGPEQLSLLLQKSEALVEVFLDLRIREMQRPLDEVLAELVYGCDGARLHVCPLTRDLPAVQPQQTGDDREGADQRDHEREPAREASAQHPYERRPQQCGDQNADEQRNDEKLQLDDYPDDHTRSRRDQEQPPRIARSDPERERHRLIRLG